MAVTDLTWEQLNAAMSANGVNNGVVIAGGKVMLDVGAITKENVIALDQKGVVKFMAKFTDGCYKAQSTANQAVPVEDKLVTFANQTVESADSGHILVSRTITTKYELASATVIIGANIDFIE